MNIEDSLEAPLGRAAPIFLAEVAAAHGRLRARARNRPRTGPCSVVPFPGGRISGPAAARPSRPPGRPRWGRRVVLLLPALSAAFAGWQCQAAREPTDAQLVAIVRRYGADLPRPVDPVAGRAVRVERTPREWVVTLIDPRRLDASRRRYVRGGRSAYHIDRATLRVVSVVVAK